MEKTKVHFRCMIWFIISEKKYPRGANFFAVVHASTKTLKQGIQNNCAPEFPILSALKLRPCGLVVFMDMNTYILTEGSDFKTFLRENYAIALNSCYLFTKQMLNMELNMMLIVLMEFAYIRHS